MKKHIVSEKEGVEDFFGYIHLLGFIFVCAQKMFF
jgi:hypothetical protein